MESVKELEDNLLQKLKDNPLDFNTLNKLGYIYLHSNNLLRSEDYYTRSIYIEPEQFEPYVSLGLICTITLRLGKALYYLLKAKEKNPESIELLKSIEEINSAILNKDSKLTEEEINNFISEAYSRLEENNISDAIESYLRLMNISPNNENILLNLAISFFKQQDFKLAFDTLKEIIEKFPTNAMAYHYAGVTANLMANFEEAKSLLTKALELKPSLADMVANGKYAHYKKDYDEELLQTCPNCKTSVFKAVNIINQSANSFSFNIINPLRIWAQCKNCDLVFANPQPDEQALTRYSFELYYYYNNLIESDVEKLLLENNAYNERLNFIDNLVEKGKALDIGSDYGIFLSVAKTRGWDISGIEENPLKCEKIKKVYELDVKNSNLKNFKTTENFNLITLWENIEKYHDFNDTFKKIYKLLKKGGLFAFSFHGNDTYITKTLTSNHPLWSYPNYLYFFSTSLLKEQLEKVGFKVINIQVVGRKYLSNVEFYCKK